MTSQEISKLSDYDLKALQNTVSNELKVRSRRILSKLRIGNEVSINHNKCRGLVYVIKKINNKTISVHEKDKPFTSYKVSTGLIEVI